MAEELDITDNTFEEEDINATAMEPSAEETKHISITQDPTAKRTVLTGMFRNWYLEYASYVILERAVPHIEDGLKPVQRRILHSMQTLDDGRFNKVANIVGNTMQYHPHGDASIGDALVQLGQKELLIDTQGNWGNILTGDSAAAPRYIEARLSEFALETVFSPKITEWTPSYDGRKKEPVTLPVKFPCFSRKAWRVSPWVFPPRYCLIISMRYAKLPYHICMTSPSACCLISRRAVCSMLQDITTVHVAEA